MVEIGLDGEIINTAREKFTEERQGNVERLKAELPMMDMLWREIRKPKDGSRPDETAMLLQVLQKKNPRVILALATQVTRELLPEYAHIHNPPENPINMQLIGFGIEAVDGGRVIRGVVTDGSTWREIDPSVDNIAGFPNDPDTLQRMRVVAKKSAPYLYDVKHGEGFLRIGQDDESRIQRIH